MEKEIAFQVLGTEETKDVAKIQAAYRNLLKSTNPEDDPEGFKRLRTAFETAIDYTKQVETEEEEEGPKSDVDLWIERVEQFYEDLTKRYQQSGWKQLLEDPVCEELDTSLEARERMLIFLMNHIYLPHEIWKMIDETFQFMDDMEDLKQHFPLSFLNYMKFYMENDTFFSYDLFEYRSADRENANGDSYIDGLMGIKRKIDQGETGGCLQELDDLKAYKVYHPYEDVERLRLYLQTAETEKCDQLIAILSEKIPEDRYFRVHVGEARWSMGQKEKAYEIWEKLLKESPDFYEAKYNVTRYLVEKGDYYQAREMMHELLDVDGNDERVQKMLEQVNELLIPEYRRKLEQGEEDEHLSRGELVLELGWCLFQNDKLEDAIALLNDFTPEKEQEYGYYNLFGRLLYQSKNFERAEYYLERWKEMLWELKPDGTEETTKRISRKNMAGSILGACYYELGKKEEALDIVKESIKVAANKGERLGSLQQLAGLLLEFHENERAIDVCDRLLKEDEGYYPAYLIRQEACFNLQKGQDVVDDYHRAIKIYPGFYKPYMFAAETFFYYNQYQDGLAVLNLAQENGVPLTPKMRLYRAKFLRNMARNPEDRKEPHQILAELIKEREDENFDLEDKSEIVFEQALLYWDEDELERAYLYIKKAIQENSERLQYHLVCGNINVDRQKYQSALKEYQAAEPEYNDSPSLYYGRGLCYDGMGFHKLALENYEKALEYQDVYADACEKVSEHYRNEYHATYKREDLEKALEYATRQIEAEENCYYLVNRGLIYMNALELEPAIADFEKALTYREDDWPAWNNLGCCYKYMGQFEKAITYFERALECMGEDRDILPYSNMADCYEALGQYQKAIDCYQKDLELLPGDFDFWISIGDMYYYMGQYQEALDAYEHAKSRDECHEDYYSKVGDVWIKKGDLRKGIGYYKKGIRIAAGREKARRFYLLGQLYTNELQDFKKGISCFRHAKEYTSSYFDWYNYERYIAKSYYMMGNRTNARKHAQMAFGYFDRSGQGTRMDYLVYKPYAPVRLASFGWLYLCLGEVEKATEYFQQMDQVYRCKQCCFQKCYESRLFMGDLHLTCNEMKKAKKAYQEALERNPHCNEAVFALNAMKEKH